MILRPLFLQTLASFEASDPWEGNRPASFCLEDYVLIAAALGPVKPLAPDSLRVKMMEHRFAVRSQPGGQPHFLPESLLNLYRSKQIPLQELPRILAGLEPGLRKPHDYYESSRAWTTLWGNRLLGVLALAGLLYWLVQILLEDASQRNSDLRSWGLLVCLWVAVCVPIELVYGRRARRRAEQKRWALEQIVQRG